MKPTQIRQILENFKLAPRVSNMVLKQYCERMKFDEVLTEGEYQDHLFQYTHDQRVLKIFPKIVAIIAKYQYRPDYQSEKSDTARKEANDDLEWEIAKVCEDEGIVYREIDIITDNIADLLSSMLKNSGNRMNNMMSVVLADLGKREFGQELVVSDLAKYYRTRSKELGVKLHHTQVEKKEETPEAKV